jgi:hypothetical protein
MGFMSPSLDSGRLLIFLAWTIGGEGSMTFSFFRQIAFVTVAFCSTSFSHLRVEANDLDIGRACEREDRKCYAACTHLQKLGLLKNLDIMTGETCEVVLTQFGSKPLVNRACGTNSCILRLKPMAANTSGNIRRYAGGGYSVALTWASDEVSASIFSPAGVITKLYRMCGEADGHCGDWIHRSGPLTNAEINVINASNPREDIILKIPR